MQCHGAVRAIEADNACRAIHILEFFKTCMRRAVRIYQTVHAEVAFVRVFARIAAICVSLASVRLRSAVDGVVAPFPDEAARQTRVFLNTFEIIFKISRPVAHGVAEFA